MLAWWPCLLLLPQTWLSVKHYSHCWHKLWWPNWFTTSAFFYSAYIYFTDSILGLNCVKSTLRSISKHFNYNQPLIAISIKLLPILKSLEQSYFSYIHFLVQIWAHSNNMVLTSVKHFEWDSLAVTCCKQWGYIRVAPQFFDIRYKCAANDNITDQMAFSPLRTEPSQNCDCPLLVWVCVHSWPI